MAKFNFLDNLAYDIEKKPIKTSILALDMVLGGGYKPGQVIEVASPSGVGKSTLMLHFCKTMVERGQNILYIDAEQGVEKEILDNMQLTQHLNKRFFLIRVGTFSQFEDALLEIFNIEKKNVKKTKKSKSDEDDEEEFKFDHVIIDSITGLSSGKQQDMRLDDVVKNPALTARYTSAFFQMYKAEFSMNGITLWLINQVRTALNFMGPTTQESTGGNALQFYPDKRIRLKKVSWLKRIEQTSIGEKEVPYGCIAHIFAKKNRTERPEVPAEMPIIFGKGASNVLTILGILKAKKLVTSAGASFTVSLFDEPIKLRGLNTLIEWISNNYEMLLDAMDAKGLLKLISDDITEEDLNKSVEEYESEKLHTFSSPEDITNNIDDEPVKE